MLTRTLRWEVLALGVFCLLLLPVWMLVLVPLLLAIPDDFKYSADIISTDDFYNLEKGEYFTPQISDTQFSYDTVLRDDNVLIIKNSFYVYTSAGEKIFAARRLYGIDPLSGKHVPGYGGRNREGYLFAPRHLRPGQNFTYWHVNYNTPALLEFKWEEVIQGLRVYRYEANFQADQTSDLEHLPSVPDAFGVDLDVNLQLWVEPVSGHLVKYEDHSTAYYYNATTRERLYPWNQFHNRYSSSSIQEQVEDALEEKRKSLFLEVLIPVILGIMGLASVALFILARGQRKERKLSRKGGGGRKRQKK